MPPSRGKDFELVIRKSFEKISEISIDRIPDQTNGFKGSYNVCDFIVYCYPLQYYIECKSHYGASIPFECITPNQWKGLLEKSKIPGVVAGVIIWFMDKDVTYFVPISVLQNMKEKGLKSIRYDTEYFHIPIIGKKKRVFFDYDMLSFLALCEQTYNKGV